jgi:hypothetical protein
MVDYPEIWRKIIIGPEKSWVVFEQGTCVILMKSEADLSKQAREILAQWGLVHPGSSAGDFGITTLTVAPGWVVSGEHPDVLNYVSPEDFTEQTPNLVQIGVLGRSRRDQDAKGLKIIHVEDRRPNESIPREQLNSAIRRKCT